jgi:hypothetical protein
MSSFAAKFLLGFNHEYQSIVSPHSWMGELYVRQKIMKAFSITIAGIVVLGLGILLGGTWGLSKGEFNAALEENKLAANLLRDPEIKLTPEFTEYLKGRIYYNIASKYPNDHGYLLRQDWDFGAVASTRLPDGIYAKDPTFDCDSFAAATKNLSRAEQDNLLQNQAEQDVAPDR